MLAGLASGALRPYLTEKPRAWFSTSLSRWSDEDVPDEAIKLTHPEGKGINLCI